VEEGASGEWGKDAYILEFPIDAKSKE